MAPITARGRQRGFGMLWALMSVALISIYLMKVGEVWSTQAQRVKEDELLRRGDAIRAAIEAYVKADKGGAFPRDLKDLTRDPRASFVRRYLRQAYDDPMTGGEWQTVRGPGGELYGVYSASTEAPLKKDGFSDSDASFATQTSYSEWKFTHFPDRGMTRR
ncbi:type II secretion system protein [Caballeronia sp. BCC1704]|uniref:type II secretion system protein n=1 Tax=Caballeronia sp. BCC1704 TaxID=2676300 RepID=UPI00158E6C65|nr:type II secretion system protein [Caballeronia sp. BCC1704]